MQFTESLLKVLSGAQSVTVLTGAGVSAESGIKTFRDPDGLWAKFNPSELASVDGFMSNPELVWSWYQHRVEIIRSAAPNPGHYAIAEFEKIFPEFTLITQNVDRLHQRAGSSNVWELHGNIVDNHCFDCQNPYHGETSLPDGELPTCPQCGGSIRPSVVWFGEMLPPDAISAAEQAALTSDVFFTVGTSAEVYPAANLPIIAKRAGAFVVEVNPRPTAISSFMDICLEGTSGTVLPLLIEALKNYKNE
jgi:NAD-dependent deacetylase